MPAILRQRLICAPSSAAAPALGPRGARRRRRGRSRAEQPRLGGLELLHVVVVGEEGAGGLDVARAGELQLEPHALLVALAPELVHLGAQLLRALCGLRGLGDLALQLRDPRVALLQRRLVVRARPRGVARPYLRRRLLRLVALRLRLLRRALVDLLRPVLQAIHLPVPSIRRAKRKPAP